MNLLPPIEEQRIMAVYAHPDDEVFCSGGTLAKYADAGAETIVIAATKGQAGQIHDTTLARRENIANVREKELRHSCQKLNVHQVECWDYMDGQLMDVDRDQIVGDVVRAIRHYQPHIIITFGPDGAYGHPDHVAISEITSEAFLRAGDDRQFPEHDDEGLRSFQPAKLYYSHFPKRRLLLLNELVKWLISQEERFLGTPDYIRGLAIFAEESAMLNYVSDHVDTRWYTPGFCILEQGEPAKDLFVILSGTVDVYQDQPDGAWQKISELTTGAFFGELGIAEKSVRSAHVVARDSVTCLVFSPSQPTNFEARGHQMMNTTGVVDSMGEVNAGDATHAIDVRNYIFHKISAIAAHKTQFSLTADMFPESILKALFGIEYFVQAYPPKKLESRL